MTETPASASNSTAEALLGSYLADSKALIVDSNPSARTHLVVGLVKLGAKRHNILSTSNFDEARTSILQEKPRVVICDYMIGKNPGLDLLQELRGAHADLKKCLFILVTGNTSQSAVARAAEEDIDTYILKPYTQELFKRSLSAAVGVKLNPNEYLRTIETGKELLFKAAPDEAIPYFEKAVGMSPQPSLACFYLGQADLLKDAIDKAGEAYERGLSHSRIHYKCLVGLFDILTRQKRFTESYEVVKKLAQYFPANPKRLASVLRLAITTDNYDDIESYYRVFVQLDERSNELVNYMCSALVVTGKHYLIKRNNRRAIELFDKAITSSAGRTRFIRYAVECLVDYRVLAEAEAMLGRFPGDARESEDYQVSAFLIMSGVSQSGKVLQRGRDLIKRGILTPQIYRAMIEHTAKSGHKDMAEELTAFAAKKWPAEAEDFAKHCEQHLRTGEVISG
jgi:DNA-binding NarL/FixJ family response regulator